MDWVSDSLDGAILDKASAKTRAGHSDPCRLPPRPPEGPGTNDSSTPLVSPSLCITQNQQIGINKNTISSSFSSIDIDAKLI